MDKKEVQKELVVKLSLVLTIGKGTGPNLNTLLGFWGIGLGIFNKEWGKYIEGLPLYFKGNLNIFYYVDRSISLMFDFYSLSFLFRLCSYSSNVKVKGPGGFILKPIVLLKLSKFLEVVLLKFGNLNVNNLKQAYGTLSSMGISIVNDYIKC